MLIQRSLTKYEPVEKLLFVITSTERRIAIPLLSVFFLRLLRLPVRDTQTSRSPPPHNDIYQQPRYMGNLIKPAGKPNKG